VPASSSPPAPTQIATALEKRIIGQKEAVREMAVALAKKLAGLKVGNILMIGSSGSGKTTLMSAVEELLAANPALAVRSTVVRIHANVLGEEAEQGHPGEKLLRRLLERARQQLGPETPIEKLLEQASHGLVFVDEVDKIRSQVGGQPNIAGIRAQEALLTLIENEAVPFTLPDWAGGETINVDSSGVLFVCAGAFEGLYDAVFHRVTYGKDQGALKPVTVVDETGRAHEELQFSLRDWLKHEDLFAGLLRELRGEAGGDGERRAPGGPRGRAPAPARGSGPQGGAPPRGEPPRIRPEGGGRIGRRSSDRRRPGRSRARPGREGHGLVLERRRVGPELPRAVLWVLIFFDRLPPDCPIGWSSPDRRGGDRWPAAPA
jgi:hypothetical protein